MIDSSLGARRQIQAVLFLLFIHSALTGFGLLVFPEAWLNFLGLHIVPQRFFVSQGGVFHLLMAGAYLAGMIHPLRNVVLIQFAIIVKFCAALFLILYFLFVQGILFVLLNALIDGFFCWLLLLSHHQLLQVDRDESQ